MIPSSSRVRKIPINSTSLSLRNPSMGKIIKSVSTTLKVWAEAGRYCSEKSKMHPASTKKTKAKLEGMATTSMKNSCPPMPLISRSTPSEPITCMQRLGNRQHLMEWSTEIQTGRKKDIPSS